MGNVSRLTRIDPFTGSADAVKARLRRKFGWTAPNIDEAVADLQAMTPSLRPAFLAFWNTGLYDASLRAGDFTLGQLVAARLLPAAAFLALDQVHKHPRDATAKLHRLLEDLKWRGSGISRPHVSSVMKARDVPTW